MKVASGNEISVFLKAGRRKMYTNLHMHLAFSEASVCENSSLHAQLIISTRISPGRRFGYFIYHLSLRYTGWNLNSLMGLLAVTEDILKKSVQTLSQHPNRYFVLTYAVEDLRLV